MLRISQATAEDQDRFMSGTLTNPLIFLLFAVPPYLLFLWSLKRLSRQKSEAARSLPGSASQS